jgi:DNA-binding MarR family transcriptional regulator
LLKRNTSVAAVPKSPPATLETQSRQLLGYFDTLFQRLMLARRNGEEEATLDFSREEIRALILLGGSERMTMTSLADRLGVPFSTATHTIDRLVAKSLVVRTRGEEDRRIVQVEISDAGKKFQANLRIKHLAMARSWLEPLGTGERETFLDLMAKITQLAKPGSEARPDARPPS